jgi:hypothetical protein
VKRLPPESVVLVDPQPRVGAVGECSTPGVIGTRTPLIARLVFALPTNKSAPAQIAPWLFLADNAGYRLGDSAGNLIGTEPAVFVHRLLTARRTNRMPISRRYSPELAPGEVSVFGMSFEYVIPPGVGIVSGTLVILSTFTTPPSVATDVTAGAVSVQGRVLYATVTALLAAGSGVDLQLVWTATDSDGNVWPRTTLVLLAATS